MTAGAPAGPEAADVLVLGAGIVGVSVAAQVQASGKRVVLFDRRPAGLETSFGNAGLIQREAVFPHPFPRAPRELLRYARNRSIEAFYHRAMLPSLLGPFARYWYHSHPDRYRLAAQHYAALIAHCVDDHLALARAAGAMDLLRPGGYTQAHQDPRMLAEAVAEAEEARHLFGVEHVAMDAAALARHEPHLRDGLAGGLHWTQPVAVIDPHALTLAYLAHFEQAGGAKRTGDVASLVRSGTTWRVTTETGETVAAPEIVVALGAWSPKLTRRWGYRPPLFVKRGYHMHYRPDGNAGLNGAVLDASNGYMLAPMRRGIRLTTGAEFARLGALPTPVQLARAEPAAHVLMPALGTRLDEHPWLGARPCTPDMLPIIGKAPDQPGVWYAFGHGHQGLTLGPTTGRLLVQMMAGDQPFTYPTPYRPMRF